jgi:hypothetical protein
MSDQTANWEIGMKTVSELRAQNEALRTVLNFYADEANWQSERTFMCGHKSITLASADGGKSARKILKKLSQ